MWHSLFKRHSGTSHPNSELCIMPQNLLTPLSYVLHRSAAYTRHYHVIRPTERGVIRGSAPELMSFQANKLLESCFPYHNSSIHFCCTDSLLMIWGPKIILLKNYTVVVTVWLNYFALVLCLLCPMFPVW